jgi:S-DNA-T family DNA segregation ATPase FtsK/SpoIIIE
VRFKVLPAIGTKISKVKGLTEELAAALGVEAVRVARQGAALMVELTRDDAGPVRLLPLLEHLDEIPPITATLGIADDGAPLLIRLPSPDVAHILAAGTTGSGKTVLLRSMILSLALLNPQRTMNLALIDPRGGAALGCFNSLPHLVRPVITEAAEATEALGSLVRLMEQRDAQRQTAPAVVVVIDELADLLMTGGDETEHRLTRLLQRGRNVGIHVVAATQKPTAAVIGGLIKSNFPVRIVGKVASANDARVAAGWSGTGAERLAGKGDFIAVAEGKVHRFVGAYVTEAQIRQELRERGWDAPPQLPAGDRHALEVKPRRPEVQIIDLPPAPEPEPDPIEALAQQLEAAGWDPSWSYRKACRALGEPEGGENFYNVKAAVDLLQSAMLQKKTPENGGEAEKEGAPPRSVARSTPPPAPWAAEILAWELGQ